MDNASSLQKYVQVQFDFIIVQFLNPNTIFPIQTMNQKAISNV